MVKKSAKSKAAKSVANADIKKMIDSAVQKYYLKNDFKALGESLHKTLLARNVSISALASESNISRMQIYNILNGKKEPKASTLFSIFKTLGIKIKIV